ncbi:hypothetical protein J6590_096544 [Homalodisca vitripennis]|nr:hypothetical protein J6590_050816 [Homalodisca vitripennis]KAG8329037.1 hypothetical protein J6590_096544 [Homalodisca vitripennis]
MSLSNCPVFATDIQLAEQGPGKFYVSPRTRNTTLICFFGYRTPVFKVEVLFGLQPLSLRIVFLNKIVSGVLNCRLILSYIETFIPKGTRSRKILQRRFILSFYAYTLPVRRHLQSGSDVTLNTDFLIKPLEFVRELSIIIYKNPG